MPEIDPFERFASWSAEARASEPNDPEAFALATTDVEGRPSVRMLLLKDVDRRGFVFYTNMESRKGVQLTANPRAAMVFHWKSLRRQVRIEGLVERVSDDEADAYFSTRPRESRIGAWASDQSRPMEGAWELERRVAAFTAKFGLGPIPRPPRWTGNRLKPTRIEFWRDRPFRLHERTLYERSEAVDDAPWTVSRLFP